MTKREALVRLVAGQMALPDSWRVVHGVTQDGEEVEHCEVFGETIENMLVSAEHALAEIEKVCGEESEVSEDVVPYSNDDRIVELTTSELRKEIAQAVAAQREKDAKLAYEYVFALRGVSVNAATEVAAAIRGGGA